MSHFRIFFLLIAILAMGFGCRSSVKYRHNETEETTVSSGTVPMADASASSVSADDAEAKRLREENARLRLDIEAAERRERAGDSSKIAGNSSSRIEAAKARLAEVEAEFAEKRARRYSVEGEIEQKGFSLGSIFRVNVITQPRGAGYGYGGLFTRPQYGYGGYGESRQGGGYPSYGGGLTKEDLRRAGTGPYYRRADGSEGNLGGRLDPDGVYRYYPVD